MKNFKFQMFILFCLLYYHGSAASMVDNGDTTVAQKRTAAGFISIDCGMTRDSRFDGDTGLYFSSDAGFIDTGRNMEVHMDYETYNWTLFNTVRSFPDGKRNCYTFKPLQGNNSNYLIRARFRYGNYDGLNILPKFDLYIGVNFWATIQPNSAETYTSIELIYAPPQDIIYVCLVKTGASTPFISALELKPLNKSIYKSNAGALSLRQRSAASFKGTWTQHYRPDDDPYNRLWSPVAAALNWGSMKTNISMNSTYTDAYKLPPSVLSAASFPVSSSAPLDYQWKVGPLNTGLVCLYWHFAEIQNLGINDSREFTISVNGNYQSPLISPKYMHPLTVVSPPISLISSSVEFSITKTNTSTLPPILNAMEVYEVVDLSASATVQDDVNAIMNIKMNYTVPNSWQGDPCLPLVPWDGLECSKNDHNSPRITSLNLSFGGLAGDIPHSLSGLTALTYLNLSYNSFTGVIPDFLAELPSLHTIDLRSNKLTGAVPLTLRKKAEDGSINLSLEGNPDLCILNRCKKKNSKVKVILAATASGTFIFTAIALFFCILIRKKPAGYIKSTSKKLGSRSFTYIEVVIMTNNFQTIIGKGGSGTVYHGSLQDGTPVAVKMLNPSSTLSLKFFNNEAELLTRVHHRNLVSIIGYCEEGTCMALIYEHVANGNLQQHLSENNVKVLSWKERLQIAIDTAQGLEYLHSGCKPPIVHRDMKASNILLDENFQAKISDFGISKTFSTEITERGLTTDVMGTNGYVDPEYYSTRRLNKKSDVFSFGVVLLELITGNQSIVRDNAENIHIIAWTTPKIERGDIENIVDKRLQGHFNTNSAWKALEIAMMCVPPTAIQRPSMKQVLIDLNDCFAIENSHGRNRVGDNHTYAYPTIDIDHDIAIADTSIEMGPSAR